MADRIISVVLPVRNEAAGIAATLASILDQEVDGTLEIVVAEGGSSDATRAIVDELAVAESRLVIVDNPTGRTPNGLNLAIRATTGDVIVRCDGHALLPAGYIARAISVLDETGAGVVGGVQLAVGRSLFQRGVAIAMTTPLGVGDARFHLGGKPGPVDTVYLGVFRREALQAAGLYDESQVRNQDYELNYRIRQAGYEVWFHPDLAVEYAPRDSWVGLWSQYFQYGTWKRVMVRRNPRSLRWRQLAAPALVVLLVVSGVLAILGAGWVVATVPIVYLAALSITVLVELARRRDIAATVLYVVIPTMHAAWGLGFLVGRAGADKPTVARLA